MAADTFFGNRAVVTVAGTSNPTSETVAVAKGIEVTVTFEHVELYGMGSILRQDVARHTAKVDFKLRFAKLDPTLANYFMYWQLNPSATTAPTGTIEDTNSVKLFTVTYKQVGTGGAIFDATISNVYFEDFPFPSPENDFVVVELTGHGSGITITNT
jgi:hypothetical protein